MPKKPNINNGYNQKTDKGKYPNYFSYTKNIESSNINGNKKTNIKRIENATLNHCTLNQYSNNNKNPKKSKKFNFLLCSMSIIIMVTMFLVTSSTVITILSCIVSSIFGFVLTKIAK